VTLRRHQHHTLLVCEPDFFGNPFTQERPDISTTLAVQVNMIRFAQRVGVDPPDVLFQDKIVLAQGCLRESKIYLERLPITKRGDSGWYIGPRAGTLAPTQNELEAIVVYELLQQRQALLPVLCLPVGYMVIVDDDQMVDVVNARNESVRQA
jgi:hypothetical protein